MAHLLGGALLLLLAMPYAMHLLPAEDDAAWTSKDLRLRQPELWQAEQTSSRASIIPAERTMERREVHGNRPAPVVRGAELLVTLQSSEYRDCPVRLDDVDLGEHNQWGQTLIRPERGYRLKWLRSASGALQLIRIETIGGVR